ncbi:LuxR C-terminal-related transcriptional regulator [Flavobacterium psychrotrophum]|uniref:LuxR C-terminal-related transcriptional regulator n=1 Tax=Flavobacterium psychrotrophum TaxID=2294119 RepID=UPI0013C51973|nr:LuxR C-terminal-related transcriptional regulator [Flavobacterium psychrotrophum]
MHNHENKVYAGILCDNVEMFNDGKKLQVLRGGRRTSFNDLPFAYIQLIREAVAKNPDIDRHLKLMHPESEMKRIEQFAICNFSGLDFTPDIQNGQMQEGEYWNCPKRGVCPAEGIVCKPLSYQGQSLLGTEVVMMKLLTTDKTNDVIAEEMKLPKGTWEVMRTALYRKLEVTTKQEITIIALRLNII